MSVFPLKYKKKSSESKRLISITKWRVQIRRKLIKVDRVFDDERSARIFERTELTRLNSGAHQTPSASGKYLITPTVRELFKTYHESTKSVLASSTIEANKNRCLAVIPGVQIQASQCGNKLSNYETEENRQNHQGFAFGDLKIHTVDFWIIIYYIENRRSANIKPNTILREISLISSAFEKVYKLYPDQFPNGLPNPVKLLPRGEKPTQVINRKRVLSEEESRKISIILKNKKNPEPYFLYVFCLQSGARKNEVLGIEKSNIDFENWSVYLPKTKNGKPRSILIPNDRGLRKWLKDMDVDQEKIFALTVSNFRYYWVEALKKVGIYDGGNRPFFHDTRRTALTKLIRKKQSNTFEIAKNIGVSPQTVEREKSIMPEMMQDIISKLRRGESLHEHEIMKLAGHQSLAMTNAYYGDRN